MKKLFYILLITNSLFVTFQSNAQINFVGDGRTHVIAKVQSNGTNYSFSGNHIYDMYSTTLNIGKETVVNGRYLRDKVSLRLGSAAKTKREGYSNIYYYETGTYKIGGTVNIAEPYIMLRSSGKGEIEITEVKGNTTISGRFYLKDDYGTTCKGIIENIKMPRK